MVKPLMPGVVHQLEHVFAGDDKRTYRVTFDDGDVFVLRQLERSSHSFDTGIAEWLAEIVERVAARPDRAEPFFTPGDFLEIAESDIVEVVDEQTDQKLYTRADGTPTI